METPVKFVSEYVSPSFEFQDKFPKNLPHTGDGVSFMWIFIGYSLILFILLFLVNESSQEE